jgi:hypothetical protein
MRHRPIAEWIGRNADNLALTAVSIAAGLLGGWYFFRKQRQPKTLDWACTVPEPAQRC